MTAGAPPPGQAAGAERVRLTDAVFISDLHLSRHRPATLARFRRFVGAEAARHRELVILGDLFDFWLGDDTDEPPAPEAAAVLRAYADGGGRLYLMQGNRDLLLGRGFCARSGATLLADPALADVAGTPALLAHGDAWCTADTAYLAFRRRARNPLFQRMFLALPLGARRALVGRFRAASEAHKRHKATEIMDVTPAAIDRALRAAGVQVLIHGHTHLPAVHEFSLDGAAATRWVLPDWDFDTQPVRGGFLLAGADGWRVQPLAP